ncbi:hypothetical protein BJX62DRAFT_244905 [Aspergillus germanicus]
MWLPVPFIAMAALALRSVEAKSAFAHYMVQSIDRSTDHAYQDIQSAMSVGFDAFALNVGAPAD